MRCHRIEKPTPRPEQQKTRLTGVLPLISVGVLSLSFAACAHTISLPQSVTAEMRASIHDGNAVGLIHSIAKAKELLSDNQHGEVVSLLGDLLNQTPNPSPNTRDMVLEILTNLTYSADLKKEALAVFNSLQKHPNAVVRGIALFTLTEHGEKTPEELAKAISLYSTDDVLQIIYFKRNTPSQFFIPAYNELSNSENQDVRVLVIGQLIKLKAGPTAEVLLADSNPMIRLYGVALKADQGDFQPAKQLLDSDDAHLRSIAVRILSESGIQLSNVYTQVDYATAMGLIHSSKQPVLLLVYNDSCFACRAFAPIMNDIARIWGNNVLLLQASAEEFNVQGTPTLILFKNAQPVSGMAGTAGFKSVDELISRTLGIQTL
ncbi:MAG: thioredoxin family protein [Candidatus Micrarchaeota archaeon]